MPRPCKRRRICAEPSCVMFGPKGQKAESRCVSITMTLDEYESIRLIDLEGMTQEQCAMQMGVARTTAQAIYGSARAKLAECLVKEKNLVIEGGDYVICDAGNGKAAVTACGCCRHCRPGCPKAGRRTEVQKVSEDLNPAAEKKSGGKQNEDCSNV